MSKKDEKTPLDVMLETPVEIKTDTKTYKVAPLSLRRLQEFLTLLNEVGGNPMFALSREPEIGDKYVKLIKVCLAKEHPDITEDEIWDNIDSHAAQEIVEKTIEINGLKKP
ncbi:MAG: hypothetical protein ACOX6M_12795 [Armatimonadota bacterium]|jgi:hypothetical protein